MPPYENDAERRFRQVERTLADFYRLADENDLNETRAILGDSKDALRKVKELYANDWEDDDLFEQRFSTLEETVDELQSHLHTEDPTVTGITVDDLRHRNLLEVVGYYKGSVGSLKQELQNYKATQEAEDGS